MTISEQYAFLIMAQRYASARGDANWVSNNIYLQTCDGRTLGEAVWNTLEFLYGAEVADQLQG
ncbi:MAG: hypothetical protein ACK6EB_24675 [Planctomyces sp.]|jgi:hypothetical protein